MPSMPGARCLTPLSDALLMHCSVVLRNFFVSAATGRLSNAPQQNVNGSLMCLRWMSVLHMDKMQLTGAGAGGMQLVVGLCSKLGT